MPYIKKPPKPFDVLKRLLKGYGLNSINLASVLGCATSTAWNKLNNPEKLTLEDLMKISKSGHVPIEEIRESIRF